MTPLKSLFDLWSKLAYTFPETNPMTLVKAERYFTTHNQLFLTHLLPQLGKAVDQSLSSGHLHLSSGIFRLKKGSLLPIFMHEWFTLLYTDDGDLRDQFDCTTLRRLRTLLFLFYKYEMPFTADQLLQAEKKFFDTDDIVKTSFTDEQFVIKDVFNALLPSDPLDIVPRHSSGATTDGFDNVDKRNIVRYIPSLHGVYTLDYFYNTRHHFDADKCNIIERGMCEPSMTVTFVPKDSRGPRTICMEPHERMYIQRGLMDSIYTHCERFSVYSGRVNFTDQTINQRLAHVSSKTGAYATLDLKDASDLVSWELISRLVDPLWLSALTALRTPTVRVTRDGKPRTIKKFAPMGSALCFPIESILFFAIASLITDDVYVYGDDIIVPTAKAIDVIDALESYGLIVNRDKSLYTGKFRESCGLDAYDGAVITPIRYRRDDYASVVAFANNFSEAFGDNYGEVIINWYESLNQVVVPRLGDMSCEPKFLAYKGGFNNLHMFKRRYNRHLHVHEYRVLTTTVRQKDKTPIDYRAYHDWLFTSNRAVNPYEESMYCETTHTTPFMRDITSRVTLNREKLGWKWAGL